jgi:hypothetical protein
MSIRRYNFGGLNVITGPEPNFELDVPYCWVVDTLNEANAIAAGSVTDGVDNFFSKPTDFLKFTEELFILQPNRKWRSISTGQPL